MTRSQEYSILDSLRRSGYIPGDPVSFLRALDIVLSDPDCALITAHELELQRTIDERDSMIDDLNEALSRKDIELDEALSVNAGLAAQLEDQ